MKTAAAVLVALFAASFVPVAVAQDPQASLPDIEDEVMCPICGTTLELSDSPQAERERELIRRLIGQGRSKEQIKDALVAEYGRDVLAQPDGNGFDLLAWLLPAVGLAMVSVLALLVLRRQRSTTPSAEAPALERPEQERLHADMARYDSDP